MAAGFPDNYTQLWGHTLAGDVLDADTVYPSGVTADSPLEEVFQYTLESAGDSATASVYGFLKETGGAINPAILTDIGLGDYIATAAYWENTDLGAATYRVVAAATGADDGGSFLDAGSFQLEAVFGGTVSVAQFGAKVDGTSDDSAAVQAAIDTAGTTTSSTFSAQGQFAVKVELPAGVTAISSIILRPNVALVGAGHAVSKLLGTTATTMVTAHSWSRISDMYIDGADTATGGIDIPGTRSIFSDLYVANIDGTGIATTGVSGTTSHANRFSSIHMRDITGIAFELNAYGYDSVVDDLWIGQCGTGIRIDGGSNNFTNIHVWESTANGIELLNGDHTRMVNCYTENNGGWGVRCAGIGVMFANCNIWANGSGGIWFDDRSYCAVVNSVFRENVGSGILLDSQTSTMVEGCIFYDFQGTPDQIIGVEETAGSNSNIVINCQANDMATPYSMVGASSYVDVAPVSVKAALEAASITDSGTPSFDDQILYLDTFSGDLRSADFSEFTSAFTTETGVAVTAAGIHAALVNLGLITA